MKIILISGYAEHGKDTLGKYIYETLKSSGKNPLILHFADYLKFSCKQYFGWDGNKDKDGRHLLQYIGTDIMRSRVPDFHPQIVSLFIQATQDIFDTYIIPDWRFPNEATTLKKITSDCYRIRIVRKDYQSSLTEEQRRHKSETALDDYYHDMFVETETQDLSSVRNAAEKIISRFLLTGGI